MQPGILPRQTPCSDERPSWRLPRRPAEAAPLRPHPAMRSIPPDHSPGGRRMLQQAPIRAPWSSFEALASQERLRTRRWLGVTLTQRFTIGLTAPVAASLKRLCHDYLEDDVVGRFCPGKRFGVGVVVLDIIVNCLFEFGYACKNAARCFSPCNAPCHTNHIVNLCVRQYASGSRTPPSSKPPDWRRPPADRRSSSAIRREGSAGR